MVMKKFNINHKEELWIAYYQRLWIAYYHCRKIIESCKNLEQLEYARRFTFNVFYGGYADAYHNKVDGLELKYLDGLNRSLYQKLEDLDNEKFCNLTV